MNIWNFWFSQRRVWLQLSSEMLLCSPMEIDVSGMLTASSPSWLSVSISETSLNFYQTTRRYIPKDSDLQKKRLLILPRTSF
jgi:hypothetical protein